MLKSFIKLFKNEESYTLNYTSSAPLIMNSCTGKTFHPNKPLCDVMEGDRIIFYETKHEKNCFKITVKSIIFSENQVIIFSKNSRHIFSF